MDPAGKVVVVTGGASGIGRALARRFTAEGARRVVVADLNGEGARAVADEIGGVGVECDVARERDVIDAIEAAGEPVDVFCANAGVADLSTEQTPDDQWELVTGVNFRAHRYAARALVPQWLERGGGYFVSTASAAGLLTQIGSATYAVTKHAAVSFAEWLSVTYGDRGIRVSCLCPMGVNTGMLQADAAPDGDPVAAAAVKAAGAVLEPEDVADDVIRAIREERFLILPHPEVLTFFQRKASDYDRWLAGMRRLQRSLSG